MLIEDCVKELSKMRNPQEAKKREAISNFFLLYVIIKEYSKNGESAAKQKF